MRCDQVRDLAAEIALGVATEPERSQALVHLASCRECQEMVGRLAEVADSIMLLAPESEPPAGFESEALARITGITGVRERSPRQRRPLQVAAAALVAAIAAAATITHVVDQQHDVLTSEYVNALRALGGSALRAAPVVAPDGHRVGEVFLYQGHPSWVFVSVDGNQVSGPARVQLDLVGRPPIVLVGLRLDHGRGSWGERLSMPVSSIRMVQVSAPGFSAEARLPH